MYFITDGDRPGAEFEFERAQAMEGRAAVYTDSVGTNRPVGEERSSLEQVDTTKARAGS